MTRRMALAIGKFQKENRRKDSDFVITQAANHYQMLLNITGIVSPTVSGQSQAKPERSSPLARQPQDVSVGSYKYNDLCVSLTLMVHPGRTTTGQGDDVRSNPR